MQTFFGISVASVFRSRNPNSEKERQQLFFKMKLKFYMNCGRWLTFLFCFSSFPLVKIYCKWLMVFFQFFVTSLFGWILALSWQSYHRLNDILKQIHKLRLVSYVLLGYGLPGLITLISLAIFYQDFETNQDGM